MRIPITLSVAEWSHEPVQLAAWLVDEGEEVEAGETVAELLRPGVLGYATTPLAGRLHRHLAAGAWVMAGESVLGWVVAPDDVVRSE